MDLKKFNCFQTTMVKNLIRKSSIEISQRAGGAIDSECKMCGRNFSVSRLPLKVIQLFLVAVLISNNLVDSRENNGSNSNARQTFIDTSQTFQPPANDPRFVSLMSNYQPARKTDEEEDGFIMQSSAANQTTPLGDLQTQPESTTAPTASLPEENSVIPADEANQSFNSQDQDDQKLIPIDANRQQFLTHDQLSARTKDENINLANASRAGQSKVSHLSAFFSEGFASCPHPETEDILTYRPKLLHSNEDLGQRTIQAASGSTSSASSAVITSTTPAPAATSPQPASKANVCHGHCVSVWTAAVLCRGEISASCPTLLQRCCTKDVSFDGTPVETSAPLPAADLDFNSTSLPDNLPPVQDPTPLNNQTRQTAVQVSPAASGPAATAAATTTTTTTTTVPVSPADADKQSHEKRRSDATSAIQTAAGSSPAGAGNPNELVARSKPAGKLELVAAGGQQPAGGGHATPAAAPGADPGPGTPQDSGADQQEQHQSVDPTAAGANSSAVSAGAPAGVGVFLINLLDSWMSEAPTTVPADEADSFRTQDGASSEAQGGRNATNPTALITGNDGTEQLYSATSNGAANSDEPILAKCPGYCAMQLFSVVCDSAFKSLDCAETQRCCILSSQQDSSAGASSEPEVADSSSGTHREQPSCQGSCLPVYHSSLCTKPSEILHDVSGCPANYLCCEDSKSHLRGEANLNANDESSLDSLVGSSTGLEVAQQLPGNELHSANKDAQILTNPLVPSLPPGISTNSIAASEQQQLIQEKNALNELQYLQSARQRPNVNEFHQQMFQQHPFGTTPKPASKATGQSQGIISQLYQMFKPSSSASNQRRPTVQPAQPSLRPHQQQILVHSQQQNPQQFIGQQVFDPYQQLLQMRQQQQQQQMTNSNARPATFNTVLSPAASQISPIIANQQQPIKFAGNNNNMMMPANLNYPQMDLINQQQQINSNPRVNYLQNQQKIYQQTPGIKFMQTPNNFSPVQQQHQSFKQLPQITQQLVVGENYQNQLRPILMNSNQSPQPIMVLDNQVSGYGIGLQQGQPINSPVGQQQSNHLLVSGVQHQALNGFSFPAGQSPNSNDRRPGAAISDQTNQASANTQQIAKLATFNKQLYHPNQQQLVFGAGDANAASTQRNQNNQQPANFEQKNVEHKSVSHNQMMQANSGKFQPLLQQHQQANTGIRAGGSGQDLDTLQQQPNKFVNGANNRLNPVSRPSQAQGQRMAESLAAAVGAHGKNGQQASIHNQPATIKPIEQDQLHSSLAGAQSRKPGSAPRGDASGASWQGQAANGNVSPMQPLQDLPGTPSGQLAPSSSVLNVLHSTGPGFVNLQRVESLEVAAASSPGSRVQLGGGGQFSDAEPVSEHNNRPFPPPDESEQSFSQVRVQNMPAATQLQQLQPAPTQSLSSVENNKLDPSSPSTDLDDRLSDEAPPASSDAKQLSFGSDATAATTAVEIQSNFEEQQQVVTKSGGSFNNKNKASSCGVPGGKRRRTSGQARGRVMGGFDAQTDFWCWQAALMNNKNEYLCGGALIGSRWVLTAAHCVTQHLRSLDKLYVRLGQTNLNDTYSNKNAKTIQVKTSYVHHNHNGLTLDNDIALLRLEEQVDFEDPAISNSICLICLPERSSQVQAGKRCTVTGYGYETEAGPAALRVRQTDVPIVGEQDCQNKTSVGLGKPFSLPANSFCAGGEIGQDSCHGDGGSPLNCLVDGYYELAGIVSWGYKCGQKDFPGLYSKVSNFVGWINQIVSVNN